MKLKFSTIIKACFIFFVLSAYSMFYLIKIPGVTNYDYTITTSIGAVVSIALLFSKNEYSWKHIPNGYKLYLGLTLAAVFILALYTTLTYARQSLNVTLRITLQYLLIFWAIPIFYILNYDHTEYKLLDFINIIALIWSIMALTHAVYYNITGGVLFTNVETVNAGIRNEMLRISLGPFANFSVLYSFYRIYSIKQGRRLFYLFSFLIIGVANVFVLQSRASLAAVVISLIVMILFDNAKSKSIRWLRKIIIIFVLLGIMFFTNIVQSYIVGEFNRYDISVSARQYAFEYYYSVFLKNPLFGFGFVRQLDYETIYRGYHGIASMDDVGFVGQLAVLGLFAGVIIVFAYLYLFKLAIDVRKYTGHFNNFMLGILAYIISTSVTLIVFDQQRIALLPIIIALFEYYAKNAKFLSSVSDSRRLNSPTL